MIGIRCKLETLETAFHKEGLYSDLSKHSKTILGNKSLSEIDKLNRICLSEKIIGDHYSLLKRCISTEKTIPKKVVDYFSGFFGKWSKGEIVT